VAHARQAAPLTPLVLIAGGGVGGLETALALRAHAPDDVAVTLMAAESHLVYRPLSVGVPFGGASTVRVDLADVAAERGFAFVQDTVTAVNLDGHHVTTQRRGRVAYDQLVLALGARQVEAIPGALTFRGPADVDRFRELLSDLEEADGGRVVFAARSATDWTLPLYEL
jgi:sulfide:quinone oxidoreductase